MLLNTTFNVNILFIIISACPTSFQVCPNIIAPFYNIVNHFFKYINAILYLLHSPIEGYKEKVYIPYKEDFYKTKVHYSNLYGSGGPVDKEYSISQWLQAAGIIQHTYHYIISIDNIN